MPLPDSSALNALPASLASYFDDIDSTAASHDAVIGNAYSAGGTDVAVADGGTGASTPAGARTNLGLGTAAVATLIDDDTMATATATNIPSAESVKAYADSLVGSGLVSRHHALPAVVAPVSGQFTSLELTLAQPARYDTPAQNNEAVWLIPLTAGTWRIDLLHYRRDVRGIYTFALSDNGSSYTDVGTTNTITASAITGITVATSGEKYLRAKMATKNASSSGYGGLYVGIGLTRTA